MLARSGPVSSTKFVIETTSCPWLPHFEPLAVFCGRPCTAPQQQHTQPLQTQDRSLLNVAVRGPLAPQKHSPSLADKRCRAASLYVWARMASLPLPHDAKHHKDHHSSPAPTNLTQPCTIHTQASVAALALRLPSSPPAQETQPHHPAAAAVARFYIPQHTASPKPRARLSSPPRSAP